MEKKLKFIENDGALFRGPARGVPVEVWDPVAKVFKPYANAHKPRDVAWGTIIDEAAAKEMMGGEASTDGEKQPAAKNPDEGLRAPIKSD